MIKLQLLKWPQFSLSLISTRMTTSERKSYFIENTSYSAMLNTAQSVPHPQSLLPNSGNSITLQQQTPNRHLSSFSNFRSCTEFPGIEGTRSPRSMIIGYVNGQIPPAGGRKEHRIPQKTSEINGTWVQYSGRNFQIFSGEFWTTSRGIHKKTVTKHRKMVTVHQETDGSHRQKSEKIRPFCGVRLRLGQWQVGLLVWMIIEFPGSGRTDSAMFNIAE